MFISKPSSEAKERVATYASKPYNSDDLDAAVCAVQSDQLSVPLAALVFGIPQSTLRDHVQLAQQGQMAKPVGHPRQLSRADELGIVKWVQLRALLRFPADRRAIMEACARVAKFRGHSFKDSKGNETAQPSEHWFNDFRQRHKGNLHFRRGTKLKSGQVALSRKEFEQTYDAISELCKTYNIQPCDMWNFDECGFDKGIGEKQKLAGPPDMARFQFFSKFTAHVTIGTAINAEGDRMDPMFIFKGNPDSAHAKDAAQGMLAGLGQSRPVVAWTGELEVTFSCSL